MRRLICLLAASALLLGLAGSALGQSQHSLLAPPKGKYGCVIGADALYAGDLYIIDGSHYRLNKSKVGVYKTVGKKMTFTSGVYKGLVRGVWHKTNDPKAPYEIALTTIKSGFTSEYCDKE